MVLILHLLMHSWQVQIPVFRFCLFLVLLFYSGLTVLTKEQALLANLKKQRMIHLLLF